LVDDVAIRNSTAPRNTDGFGTFDPNQNEPAVKSKELNSNDAEAKMQLDPEA